MKNQLDYINTFESLPDPYLVLSTDFYILTANRAYLNATYTTLAEIEGKYIFEVFPDNSDTPEASSVKNLEASLLEVIKTRLPHEMPVQRYDVFKRTSSNQFEQRYWKTLNIPVLNAEGAIEYIIHKVSDVTELMEASSSLKGKKKNEESEIQFRNILLQSPNIFVILEGFPEMTITFANDPLFKSWGRTAEIIGKPLLEAMPELKEQSFPKLLQEVFKTGKTYYQSEEKAILIKDGVLVDTYYEYVYQAIFDDNQKVTGVTIMATDITEQVTARRKIEESEKRFSNLLMESPFAVAILKGEDMVVALANDAIKQIWGKGNEIENKSLFSLMPEIKEQGFATLLEQVYTTGKPFYGHEVLVKLQRNGVWEEVYFNFIYQPYKEADEIISGITIIANEVTTQAVANKKIAASEQNVSRLFMQAPAVICVLRGPQHVFELANEGYMQLVGNRDILGKPIQTALPELEGTGIFEILDHVFTTGEPHIGNELPVKLENGAGKLQEIYFNFVYQTSLNNEGEIDGILVHAVDVTEQVLSRKNIEESEKQQAFLLMLSDTLRPLSNPVDIEEAATKTAMDFMGADWCHYVTIEGDNLIIQRGASRDDFPSLTGVYPISSFTLFNAALNTGIPTIVDDVYTTDILDEELKQLCIQLQNIAILIVPIVKNGKLVGLLVLVQSKPRKWTDSEVQLTIETAERTWAAVERGKSQESLKKSEERLRLALETAELGTFLWYPQEDRTDIDERMRILFGLIEGDTITLAEALSKTIHPDDREFYAAGIAKAVSPNSDGKLDIDYRIFYPDGTLHWLHIYGHTFFSNEKPPQATLMYGMVLDITERKHREAHLAFLAQINADLVLLDNTGETMNALGEKIGRHFNASRFSLFEFNEAADEVVCEYNWHPTDEPSLAGSYRTAHFYTDEFLQTMCAGETFVLKDRDADSRVKAESLAALNIASLIAVPQTRYKRLKCVLCIYDSKARDWLANEVELMRELTTRIWTRLERARAEEALRKSEQRLQRMVNVPFVGVMTFDDAGNLHANDAFIKMLGYTRTEFEKRSFSWRSLTTLPHMEVSLKVFEELKKTKRGGPYEKEYIQKDGSLLWVMFVAADLEDGTIVEYAIDISERKKTEEALRKSEDRLQLATHAAKMGTFVYYPGDDHTEADEQSLVLLGLPPKGKINLAEALNHIIHPDDREHYAKDLAQAIDPADNGTLDSDIRIINPDGSVHWVNVTAQTYFEGQPPCAIKMHGVVIDITERKEAQRTLQNFNSQLEQEVADRTRELQQNYALVQTIYDTNLVGMSVLAPLRNEQGLITDFKFIMVNKKVEKSAKRYDMVGQLYSEIYPGIKQMGLLDLMVKTIETGETGKMEYYFTYEGIDNWYSTMFVKGEDILVSTTLDITERKIAEEKRLRAFVLLGQSEELTGLGSWDYDLLTGNFIWSDGMYRLFNLEKGKEVKPEIYLQYATADCRDTAARIAGHIKHGDAEFEESLTINVGETVKVVKLKASVIKNDQGHPVRVLGVDMDVTATRVAEEKLRRLEAEQQMEIFRVTLRTQEEERRRISESLHNGLGQLLYGIKISMSELTPLLAQQNDKGYASSKQYTEELLTDAIKESRRISHELMPMTLDEFGLTAAVEDICQQLHNAVKFHCRIQLKGIKLDKYFELAVYRTVQELMLNVVKHAQATIAHVDISVNDGKILIRVEDNGKGLGTSNAAKTGIGLASIRSKANLLNGSVNLTSTLGKGTIAKVSLTIDPYKN